MSHRRAVTVGIALTVGLLASGRILSATQDFDVVEKTIPELQQAMERGDVTSKELVRRYLERLEAFDQRGPKLNAMIHLNAKALEEAEALDRERVAKGARGPLHGIPIILKDNYDTKDMPTTAGSIALAGFIPPDDGFQVRKLREAGAVFIGKSNMHELARGITTISSFGGQTRNPYDPSRNPGGSSGGTGAAIAANFAAVGMGSDTCGSIRIPAANNNLFGLRVTQGLSSRDGIVPLSHTQDVGGPIARSMVDLVLVLDATVGPDPSDPQTAASQVHIPESYMDSLQADALKGARLGLLKPWLSEEGPEREVTEVVKKAVERMEQLGAETEEVDIEDFQSLLDNPSVINEEFKFDLNDYLAAAANAPVASLQEILDKGLYHRALERGFVRSNEVERDEEDYQALLAAREAIRTTLTKLMVDEELDAIVYPTLRQKPVPVGEGQPGTSCRLSARSGLPAISIPAGFTDDGVPVGVELLGKRWSERQLIAMAYAYEQAVTPRRLPFRTPSLVANNQPLSFQAEAKGAEMVPSVASEATVPASFHLDRPTQVLAYQLVLNQLPTDELMGIRLHRGEQGANGPVLVTLPAGSRGELTVTNRVRENLMSGKLYMTVYTTRYPRGELRGQLRPR